MLTSTVAFADPYRRVDWTLHCRTSKDAVRLAIVVLLVKHAHTPLLLAFEHICTRMRCYFPAVCCKHGSALPLLSPLYQMSHSSGTCSYRNLMSHQVRVRTSTSQTHMHKTMCTTSLDIRKNKKRRIQFALRYNPKTKKYVCWFHLDTSGYKFRHVGIFESESPVGPFVFVHALQPDGIPSLVRDTAQYVHVCVCVCVRACVYVRACVFNFCGGVGVGAYGYVCRSIGI